MRGIISTMRHYFELLVAMTKKELTARYKNTVFGFLWIILNPLLQMLIIGSIFRFFIKEPIPHYNYHLFAGLLIWNFFSLSLTKATPSIVNERSLIKKAKFPRSVIPLSIILSDYLHSIVAFGLYLITVLFIGTLSPFGFLCALLAFFLIFLFTSGLGLLTAALNVRFRDMNFFVQAGLIIWFYATPIVYSLNLIPLQLLWLWRFNPMTSILQLLQFGLLKAEPPGPAMLTANIFVILFVAILGIVLFQKESQNFDDWV